MMVTRQKQPNQSPTGLFAIKEPTKTWEVFMYSLLIKLMILSALLQLGISLSAYPEISINDIQFFRLELFLK